MTWQRLAAVLLGVAGVVLIGAVACTQGAFDRFFLFRLHNATTAQRGLLLAALRDSTSSRARSLYARLTDLAHASLTVSITAKKAQDDIALQITIAHNNSMDVCLDNLFLDVETFHPSYHILEPGSFDQIEIVKPGSGLTRTFFINDRGDDIPCARIELNSFNPTPPNRFSFGRTLLRVKGHECPAILEPVTPVVEIAAP